MSISLNLRFLAALVISLVASTNAWASVSYNYTGKPFVGAIINGIYFPNIASNPLSMSLTFSDDGTTLIDWNASQTDIGTITKADATGLAYSGLTPQINLRTDSTGQVSAWYVSIYSAFDRTSLGSAYKQSVLSLSGLDYWGNLVPSGQYPWPLEGLVKFNTPQNIYDAFTVTNERNSGTWTSTGTISSLNFKSNYQVSSVPEPAIVRLLAGLTRSN